MSDYPPDEGSNPYPPSTQYPSQPGYYPPDQPPQQYGYQQSPQQYAPQAYMPQPQYGVVMPVNEPGYSQAMTGMILGIVSIFVPIVGIVGIIFSIMGLKSVSRKGMAIAGVITSCIGIFFILITIVFVVIAIASASAASSSSGY
jgi:hypothetical protein